MPAHHAGYVILDITSTKCSKANPFSKCVIEGPDWHRIEKELFLGSGWVSKAYIHVRRKKEEELVEGDKVVLDVKVGNVDPTLEGKVDADAAWESRPGGIWLLMTGKKSLFDTEKVVKGVDILFGADAVDPRDGWTIKDTALLVGGPGENLEARLSIRRGQHVDPVKPSPRIADNGKFKIMQVADLHLATGIGVCRDPMPEGVGNCDSDTRTLEFIGRLLDEEKPHMVVLTGDQVNGDTAPDAQSVSENDQVVRMLLTLAGHLQICRTFHQTRDSLCNNIWQP